MRTRKVLTMLTVFVTAVVVVEGQQRPLSPRGQSSTQVGGSYDAQGRYQGGHWIDIDYGRPILRGRENIFGEGDEFGQRIYAGAPIWRIGADPSTRFSTEVDLVFGGQRLPAGEYSIFADLKPGEWTLVFSNHGAKQTPREDTPNTIWGAYGYTPDMDVLRTTMQVTAHPVSADQLIVTFTDMTQQGGNFTIWWDNQIATTAFTVAP